MPVKLQLNMKYSLLVLSFAIILVISACQPAAPACPPDSISYVSQPALISSNSTVIQKPSPAQVEINGKLLDVDSVVNGPLCDGIWSGTIYVACDLQILEWQEEPTFLEGCNLSIEPGTVVYVAAHNDAPYYQGCSCHTGEVTQ